MKLLTIALLGFLLLPLASCKPDPIQQIMVDGTIFIDPDIITASDPSLFSYLKSIGTAKRQMYDNRTNAWTEVNATLSFAR